MAIRLQVRRDTEANWIEANPVLAQGEIIEVLPGSNEAARFKIGDGVTAYNNLPFIETSWGSITGTLSNQTDLQNALDGKVDELSSPATAGTYTKVTINSDGLVSSGTTLSASDIPDISATYYLASNPDGFISGITSSDVTTALGYTPYDSSNPAGYTDNVGTVTSVNNVQPVNGNVTIDLSGKVDKTTTADRVYGTDANGDQTTYDKNSFGQVDDVTVGGTSVVTNKVAILGSMAGETASDYATAAQGALADSAVQTINNIAPIDGNATIEAGAGLKLSDQNEFNILQEDERDSALVLVGNPTQVSTNIYTNFYSSRYIKLPQNLVLNGTDDFEMVIKAKTGTTSTSINRIMFGLLDSTQNFYFAIKQYSGIFKIYYRLSGGITKTLDSSVSPSQIYNNFGYFKFKRTVVSGVTTMNIEFSSDGTTWTTLDTSVFNAISNNITFTNNTFGYVSSASVGTGDWGNGQIDFNESYIKINNSIWWSGQGIISKPVAKATDSLYGLVKSDNLSITVNDGVISASITDNVTSTSTTSALSANMGKELQDQVDNLKARGRFLALWDCSTGLAETHPTVSPYEYKAGDYFIVGIVAQAGGTNYKPSGSSYTDNVPSTAVETVDVSVDDVYYYDGNVWHLQINTQKEIAFVNIAGDPYDNSNLASALNDKQDELPSQTGQSGKFLTTNGTAISWGEVTIPVTDVQINSTSILSNGVANIPVGTSSVLGVYKVNPNQGISAFSSGDLCTISASEQEITAKTQSYKPIVPNKLDIAIREGLGNNSLTWTDTYKSNARNTIGATQAVFVDWSD